MAACDGTALLAAAVRAACMANASSRTVQAVAAAVAGVLVHQPASATAGRVDRLQPSAQQATDRVGDGDDATSAFIEALRSERRAQRKRKKQRRRAAKAAAKLAETVPSERDKEEVGNAAKNPDVAGEQKDAVNVAPPSSKEQAKPQLQTESKDSPRSSKFFEVETARTVHTPPRPESAPPSKAIETSGKGKKTGAHKP